MGFLDKLKTAAATAKDELDRSGLLDHLSAPSGSSSATTAASGAPPWDAAAELASVLRRGGLDPRTLITADEVAAIAGHAVGPHRVTGPFQEGGLCFEGSFVDLSFDGDGEVHSLWVFHSEDEDQPWSASDWFDAQGDTEAVWIDDLGERAVAIDANVYVMEAGRVLGAVVTGDGVSQERSRTHAEAMLRTAITHL